MGPLESSSSAATGSIFLTSGLALSFTFSTSIIPCGIFTAVRANMRSNQETQNACSAADFEDIKGLLSGFEEGMDSRASAEAVCTKGV